jgi:hypothetical protein
MLLDIATGILVIPVESSFRTPDLGGHGRHSGTGF